MRGRCQGGGCSPEITLGEGLLLLWDPPQKGSSAPGHRDVSSHSKVLMWLDRKGQGLLPSPLPWQLIHYQGYFSGMEPFPLEFQTPRSHKQPLSPCSGDSQSFDFSVAHL